MKIKVTHKLFFNDGMPVGWRMERGLSLPVNIFEFETHEEAEEARLKLEAYETQHQPKTNKKK